MFDWRGFLDLATELGGRNDEASLRSSVSRAYYSAFCSARNFLRDREGISVPKSGQAHRIIWREFENHADYQRRRVGQLGLRLRRSRNKADYDDSVERLEDITQDALADAQAVLGFLEAESSS